MDVVYATETPPASFTSSIFLAGPSPRDPTHPNWRPAAISHLEALGYNGVVFIPLPRDGQWLHSYDDQVGWETTYLNMADLVLFWVPRNMKTLPALTTNMEFGLWVKTGKAVLGFPGGAPKMRYLDWHADKESVPVFHDLKEMLKHAVNTLKGADVREGGERDVPYFIWKLPHFQDWYRLQQDAGNRLDGAELLWNFRVGPNKGFTFAYVMHVDVHITSEGRNKVNEFIFGRPDIATIVGYQGNPWFSIGRKTDDSGHLTFMSHLLNTKIAIIREFRSPARTADGFIRELPGGSSWKPGEDPFTTMTHELEEETGLGEDAGFGIEPQRLYKVGMRQLCGTLSVHMAHVFACELTKDEMAFLEKQQADNTVHGVAEDTERTYVEVHRLGELMSGSDLDWSMMGMILTALMQEE